MLDIFSVNISCGPRAGVSVSTGGGPDAASPALARAGQARWWSDQCVPVVSVSRLRSSDGHWSDPVTTFTCDDDRDQSVALVIHVMIDGLRSKSPCVLVARPPWCYLVVTPCDVSALLCLGPGSVLARQVSLGQEPLTYIFTFLCLSWSPGLKFWDSQKLGDRTRAYTTPQATHKPDSEKWIKCLHTNNPGILWHPDFKVQWSSFRNANLLRSCHTFWKENPFLELWKCEL